MASHVDKPRLTGWAAAALKADAKLKANSSAALSGTSVVPCTSTIAHAKKNKDLKDKRVKKLSKSSFNRNEVQSFLLSSFNEQLGDCQAYKSSQSGNKLDWDTNAKNSNKWRSKKYGHLIEVARALRM